MKETNRFGPASALSLLACAFLMAAPAVHAAPMANVSRTAVGFGILYSVVSEVQAVFVTNTGDAPLNISALSMSGPNASEFIVGGTCTAPISLSANGGRCRIDIKSSFNPQNGPRAATLTLQSDASPAAPAIGISASINGGAIFAPWTPTWIDFAAQAVGTTSAVQTFAFTNPFVAQFWIDKVLPYHGDSSDFAVTTDCATVLSGGNCTISVTFVPTATGPRSTELEIDYRADDPNFKFVHRYSITGVGGVAGPIQPTQVVEYYNAVLDHYFITWVKAEQDNLDAGKTPTRWERTSKTLNTYTMPQNGTSPVCRFYIPPDKGDSHFFGRGTAECDATGQKNPTFVNEDPAFMNMFLPAGGVCPANTMNVYRVFSNRPDANHRYMTDKAVRDQMVAKGWIAEGDGPDLVVMCAPQ